MPSTQIAALLGGGRKVTPAQTGTKTQRSSNIPALLRKDFFVPTKTTS